VHFFDVWCFWIASGLFFRMRLAGWLLSPWALIAHGSMRRSAGCAENYPMQSEIPYAIQRSRAEVITDFERFSGRSLSYTQSYAPEGDLSRTGPGDNCRFNTPIC
jgi:hypothetical protein